MSFVPIPNPLPVSGPLTDSELRASPVETLSSDFAGRKPFNTLFGEAVVGWHSDDVSVMFQYNNATNDVKTTISGSGATSNSNSQAVASITGAVGSSTITSVDPLRYRPGHEAIAQFTTVYNGAQSGVSQYHGLLNSSDGAAFGTKDGVFGAWFITGGVETFIPQSSFSGDKIDGSGSSGVTIDPTKMNIYMVQFGWLGVAPILFSVFSGSSKGWVLCHKIDQVNSVNVPHLGNPSLPLAAKVIRASGSGTAADLRTSSWRAGVTSGDGEANSSNRWFSKTVLEASITAGSVRNNVFAIRNEAAFQGKTNHVVIELGIVTFDNAGNKTVAFYGTKGPTGTVISGPTSTASVDSGNSVVTILTGGTVVGGIQGPATVIKAGGDRRTDVRGTGIIIYPGETFAFEAVAATFTGTISLSARWIERF